MEKNVRRNLVKTILLTYSYFYILINKFYTQFSLPFCRVLLANSYSEETGWLDLGILTSIAFPSERKPYGHNKEFHWVVCLSSDSHQQRNCLFKHTWLAAIDWNAREATVCETTERGICSLERLDFQVNHDSKRHLNSVIWLRNANFWTTRSFACRWHAILC